MKIPLCVLTGAVAVLAVSSAWSPSFARERSGEYVDARRYAYVEASKDAYGELTYRPRMYQGERIRPRAFTRAEVEGIRVLERMR